METVYRDCLSDREASQLKELVESCNLHDGTVYSTPQDADAYALAVHDGRIIGAVCVYRIGSTKDGKEADELYCFTDPLFRRQAVFSSLLSYISPILRDVLVFPVYEGPEDTAGVLKALSAEKDHDEHFMERKLEKAADGLWPDRAADELWTDGAADELWPDKAADALPSDRECPNGDVKPDGDIKIEALSESDLLISSRFCECSLMSYGEATVYLYGMLTYAKYQGKGYGSEFMRRVIALLSSPKAETFLGKNFSHVERIILQVSSENIPALKLYKKSGFHISESLSFYNIKKKDHFPKV